jgi:hypothetical protein
MSTGRAINGEKKMRVKLLAAGAVLALVGSSAHANFIVTGKRDPATGAGVPAGYEMIRWFAVNDGVGGSGNQLQSVDATMSIDLNKSPNGKFFVNFQDADNDGAPDANFTGGGSFIISNPPGSYIRVGGALTFGTTFVPPGAFSDPDGTGAPTVNPLPQDNPAFANVKSFRVAGANTTGPVLATTAQNAGLGAQFAAAIVPAGTVVNFSGFIAGKVGPNNLTFTATDPVPEPTTVGLLGVGAVGLLSRRRRKA